MLQTDLYSFSYKKGSLVPSCKRCGGQNFYKNGKNKEGIIRYRCRNCNFRFVWTSDLPKRKFFSSVIGFAVEIYTSLRMAVSLRGVTDIVKKAFGVFVSYETIRQWVLTTKKPISRREIAKATTWHADETYIKIKGNGYWLWIVYDKIGVLAWHISKKRKIKDAKIVLKKALEVAGTKPAKIITDGLKQYCYAINKIIRWNWRVQKEKHIVSSGIGRNWFIERLNREVKRRIKYFSTFQSYRGAKAFFGLWFYHYNQFKSSHDS
ncbi:MAG: DDE-type integrase/transposase/recombinase [Nanoarchaeota archaeon]